MMTRKDRVVIVQKEVVVPTFRGGAGQLAEFKEKCVAAWESQNIQLEKDQRKFVRSHLSESVKDDLDCYPKEHLETLENIWNILEKAYGDQRPVQQLLTTFNSLAQYPGEGVRDFSNRVNKAFRDLTARQRAEGQRPLDEQILKDQFISGLQDGILMRQVRTKTMEGPGLSFIDVRLYAIKWELQETNMRKPAPHVEVAVASAEPQHALTDLTKMISKLVDRVESLENKQVIGVKREVPARGYQKESFTSGSIFPLKRGNPFVSVAMRLVTLLVNAPSGRETNILCSEESNCRGGRRRLVKKASGTYTKDEH
ncbi:hypothetical protein ACOMHN_064984 [Nucella lapillus]